MNDTIPPLSRKLLLWLRQPGVLDGPDDILERAVADMISDHVPIDAMVKERTTYRDLLRNFYCGGVPSWMDDVIEKTFADMGETLAPDETN